MPKTFIGTSEIKKIWAGADQVKKIWVGTNLVYQNRIDIIKSGVVQTGFSAVHNGKAWDSSHTRTTPYESRKFAYDSESKSMRVTALGTTSYNCTMCMSFRLSAADLRGRKLNMVYTKSNSNWDFYFGLFKTGVTYLSSNIVAGGSEQGTATSKKTVTVTIPANLADGNYDIAFPIAIGNATNSTVVSIYNLWLE